MTQLLTSAEVAQQLRVRPRWVEDMARAGKIRGLKVGHYWRFRQADVDAYLESVAGGDPMARTPQSRARRRRTA